MATQNLLSGPLPVPEDPEVGEASSRLWIGNLDPKVTEFALLKILQKYGELDKFDFLYHTVGPDQGKPRGYCFVSYCTREGAEKALNGLNGKLALNKRLVVRWAHKEETAEGQKKVPAKVSDEPKTKLSTDAKIHAIEMKLKNMEKSQKDFTLSLKPELPPGTSRYSAARLDSINKRNDKPYRRGNNNNTKR